MYRWQKRDEAGHPLGPGLRTPSNANLDFI